MTNPLSNQLPAVRRNGYELQDGAEQSRLLNYLPSIYADDPFLDGFLKIFESIWSPLERQLDVLYAYFDPHLTPSEFLPWLSTWVDLALDENWPEARRRELIRRAAELYRRRGTAGGGGIYAAVDCGLGRTSSPSLIFVAAAAESNGRQRTAVAGCSEQKLILGPSQREPLATRMLIACGS